MLAAGETPVRQGRSGSSSWLEPHPRTRTFDLTYLEGGGRLSLGPDLGGRNMFATNTRRGFVEEARTSAKLLNNLEFTPPWKTKSWVPIWMTRRARDAANGLGSKANPDVADTSTASNKHVGRWQTEAAR